MEYIQTLFNDLAKGYDYFCQIASFYFDRFWRKKVNFFIREGEIVLDLGTGTGELAFEINKAKIVVGMDFSWEMLEIAQLKNLTKRTDLKYIRPGRKTQRVEFILANALSIPFSNNSFNSVVSGFVFRHLKNNFKVYIKEIYRVIKPEGKIIILEFSRPEFAFLRKIYYFYLDRVIPFIGSILFGKEKVKYFHYLKETIVNFFSAPELKRLLSSAGFKKVGYHPLLGGIISIYYGFK